jgi:hypothetical protein
MSEFFDPSFPVVSEIEIAMLRTNKNSKRRKK